MTNEIDFNADILDVRDLIERFEELEDGMTDEEFEEFETLKSVLKSLAGYGGDHQWRGDWYPIALIRDNYFTEYAMDLLADIGDLPREIPSYIVIDQDATAENIKVDYSTIDIDGTEYYYR